jgi:DNA-binding response OmpR family regulator
MPELELSAADAASLPGSFDAILVPVWRLPEADQVIRMKAGGAVVVGYGPPEHLRAAFLAGCDDYLKDPWDAVELGCRLERCRQGSGAAAGGAPAGDYQFSWGTVHLGELAVCAGAQCSSVSLPEYRILAALLRHRSEPVPREVLYYAIWGRSGQGRSRVVDVHVSSLRRKLLGLFPESAGCLRCLRGAGYLLR